MCGGLGRPASDKPRGRKPRVVYARWRGRFALWGFGGGHGGLRGLRGLLDREDLAGRETGGHGVATALRWRRRVLPGEVGPRGGLEPSGAVAGLGGRHGLRFWAAVMVTLSAALACGGAHGPMVCIRAQRSR